MNRTLSKRPLVTYRVCDAHGTHCGGYRDSCIPVIIKITRRGVRKVAA